MDSTVEKARTRSSMRVDQTPIKCPGSTDLKPTELLATVGMEEYQT